MDVKRYDATVEYGPGWDAGASAVMDEAADGDWVEFTDYAALRAECDRLRAERDAATREAEICKAIIKHCGGSFAVKCMLCGKPFDVRDPDWLKHDLTCPKHPMRDVERERDEAIKKYQTEHRLREALEETRVAYGDNRVMGVERERDALARRMRVVEMGFWIKVEDGRYYIMAPHPYAVVGPFGRYADGWTEKRSRLEVVADSLIGRESVAVALDAAATALEKAGLMGRGAMRDKPALRVDEGRTGEGT